MKRKFAVLTTLGALIALAIPASSMASMYPAGHKFEITGSASGPKITTSLGNCLITKITGQIPAAPTNEEAGTIVPVVTAGACSAGTSMTLGSWTFTAFGYNASLIGKPETVVLRFTSLPGCKLTNTGGMVLGGLWSNGTTTPTLLKSGFHPHSKVASLTWANDGGSCALAGKTEALTWEATSSPEGMGAGVALAVTDTTSPTTPIIVGNNK